MHDDISEQSKTKRPRRRDSWQLLCFLNK